MKQQWWRQNTTRETDDETTLPTQTCNFISGTLNSMNCHYGKQLQFTASQTVQCKHPTQANSISSSQHTVSKPQWCSITVVNLLYTKTKCQLTTEGERHHRMSCTDYPPANQLQHSLSTKTEQPQNQLSQLLSTINDHKNNNSHDATVN